MIVQLLRLIVILSAIFSSLVPDKGCTSNELFTSSTFALKDCSSLQPTNIFINNKNKIIRNIFFIYITIIIITKKLYLIRLKLKLRFQIFFFQYFVFLIV